MSQVYESLLCVKTEVLVYKIPPRPSNRGYRAADWNLDVPDWTGRLKVVGKGELLILRLEDKNSGQLFAQCPVESYPSVAIEAVTDSSRFFVIRIQSDDGKNAFIGLGFRDRTDSFDMNVAIQDHFRHLKNETEATKPETLAAEADKPKLDLGFSSGETIRINIGAGAGTKAAARSRPKSAGGVGLLPPPPAPGTRVRGGGPTTTAAPPPPSAAPSSGSDLLDFNM